MPVMHPELGLEVRRHLRVQGTDCLPSTKEAIWDEFLTGDRTSNSMPPRDQRRPCRQGRWDLTWHKVRTKAGRSEATEDVAGAAFHHRTHMGHRAGESHS